jgi:hypothetical protein
MPLNEGSRKHLETTHVCPRCAIAIEGNAYFVHARTCGVRKPANETGLCECGCGQQTPLAKTNSKRFGHVKGQPLRFVKGHQRLTSLAEYLVQDCGYSSPCWVWQRYKNKAGYGRMFLDGRARFAYKVYYERAKGLVAPGFEIDHLCRNRACVNPDHLEAVRREINVQRGALAKLAAADVWAIRQDTTSSHGELAEKYGVTRECIGQIRLGRRWKNVKFSASAAGTAAEREDTDGA